MIAITWLVKLAQGGPAFLFACLAAIGAWLVKRRVDQLEARHMQDDVAEALATNHAVEQKEEAATTDEEADHALDAAAATDAHHRE